MKDILLKSIPHVVAIVAFACISVWYFNPYLDGYELRQGDVQHHIGMSKEIADYRAETGEEALWTNSTFGGMPAYQVSVVHSSNWIRYIDKILRLFMSGPMGTLFLCFLGFYIMTLCIKVNPWIGLIGAIGFGLATFNILYLGAGHNSKVHAVAYMAPTLGAMLMTLRGKWLLGGALTALFLCLHLTANHLQMTYYLFFLLLFAGIAEAVGLILKKEQNKLFVGAGVLVAAAIIAVLPTLSNIMTTYEYSSYSTRGASDLTVGPDGEELVAAESTGLSKDYILEYSFGKGEIFSLIIPDVKGGSSGLIGNDRELLKDVSRNNKQIMAYGLKYWGEQKFTGGAFYFGVIMFLLFLVSFFVVKGPLKWGMLAMTLLAVILSWKQGVGLTDFFIDKVPMFNKFRDTKMMLVTVQLIFPLMAVLALDRILVAKDLTKTERNRGFIGIGALALLMIIWTASPTAMFDFTNEQDAGHFAGILQNSGVTDQNQLMTITEDLVDEVQGVRVKIFQADAVRSLMFALVAMILLALAMLGKLDRKVIIPVFCILVLWDLLGVDLRYLNHDKQGRSYTYFQDKWEKKYPYVSDVADDFIYDQESAFVDGLTEKVENRQNELKSQMDSRKPKNLDAIMASEALGQLALVSNYRVLYLANKDNQFVNLTQDARTSFFHKSLGGYHGAKMRRYQDLIDFHLGNEMQSMARNMNALGPIGAFAETGVLNMLNTKYVIANEGAPPIMNPRANGNAWFVDSLSMVSGGDEEIQRLGEINTLSTALIDERFESMISASPTQDVSAYIEMVSYQPNLISYESNSAHDQVAVFSEIYYPEGWQAYINGNAVEHFRTNYLLRGLVVPAGENAIEFRFEPSVWRTSSAMSLAGSVLLILLLGFAVFKESKEFRNPE